MRRGAISFAFPVRNEASYTTSRNPMSACHVCVHWFAHLCRLKGILVAPSFKKRSKSISLLSFSPPHPIFSLPSLFDPGIGDSSQLPFASSPTAFFVYHHISMFLSLDRWHRRLLLLLLLMLQSPFHDDENSHGKQNERTNTQKILLYPRPPLSLCLCMPLSTFVICSSPNFSPSLLLSPIYS